MIYRLVGVLLSAQLFLSGCDGLQNNQVKLSLKFDVTTQEVFDDAHRLYIRFDDESSTANTPSKFVNGRQARGWENSFKFPDSGVLTGTACLQPNLIGFVNVHKSEGPDVRKNIDLIQARPLDLQTVTPRNEIYALKEYSQIDLPEFSLASMGVPQDIISVCSVNFSHSSKVDFLRYFDLVNGKLVMKPDMLSLFEVGLRDATSNETEARVMGLVEVDGSRVGFTASVPVQITSEGN